MDQGILVSDESFWEKTNELIGESPGIYKLHCYKGNSKEYIPINRLLGTDSEGLLYIGCGKSLSLRVNFLMMALSAAAGKKGYTDISKHSCGYKYRNEKIQQVVPYENLYITVYPNIEKDPYVYEREELEYYENKFGEAPPFNEARSRAKRLFGC